MERVLVSNRVLVAKRASCEIELAVWRKELVRYPAILQKRRSALWQNFVRRLLLHCNLLGLESTCIAENGH